MSGFANGGSDAQSEKMGNFMSLTGADNSISRQFLKQSNWNLENALNTFFAVGGDPSNLSSSSSSTAETETVRAPIPSKRQRLVGGPDDFYVPPQSRATRRSTRNSSNAGGNGSGGRPLRSFRREAELGGRQARQRAARDRISGRGGGSGGPVDLNELFAPPVDILFKGTFEQARQMAMEQGRWLLINIQEQKEFASHALNRDVWRNETVREVVSSSSVFWMAYMKENGGKQYANLYRVKTFPHVAIVDPRTGAEVMVIPVNRDVGTAGKGAAKIFLQKFKDFVDRNPLNSNSPLRRNGPAGHSRGSVGASAASAFDLTGGTANDQQGLDLGGMTEEEMLQAAIRASMADSASDDKVAGAESDEVAASNDNDAKTSAARYGPNLPEPDSGAPGTTTIAFRFPDGKRIKRRFRASGDVRGLFAFVQENVDENISFEIRTTYPPKSLAGVLEQSITDAGISGSSLMVKYL